MHSNVALFFLHLVPMVMLMAAFKCLSVGCMVGPTCAHQSADIERATFTQRIFQPQRYKTKNIWLSLFVVCLQLTAQLTIACMCSCVFVNTGPRAFTINGKKKEKPEQRCLQHTHKNKNEKNKQTHNNSNKDQIAQRRKFHIFSRKPAGTLRDIACSSTSLQHWLNLPDHLDGARETKSNRCQTI